MHSNVSLFSESVALSGLKKPVFLNLGSSSVVSDMMLIDSIVSPLIASSDSEPECCALRSLDNSCSAWCVTDNRGMTSDPDAL